MGNSESSLFKLINDPHSAKLIEETFKKYDKDSNGKINGSEFENIATDFIEFLKKKHSSLQISQIIDIFSIRDQVSGLEGKEFSEFSLFSQNSQNIITKAFASKIKFVFSQSLKNNDKSETDENLDNFIVTKEQWTNFDFSTLFPKVKTPLLSCPKAHIPPSQDHDLIEKQKLPTLSLDLTSEEGKIAAQLRIQVNFLSEQLMKLRKANREAESHLQIVQLQIKEGLQGEIDYPFEYSKKGDKRFRIEVKTGDAKGGAGTDSKVEFRVFSVAYGKPIVNDNNQGWINLSKPTQNNFEKGRTDFFDLDSIPGIEHKIPAQIQVRLGRAFGIFELGSWFLDHIIIYDNKFHQSYSFLLHDWVKGGELRSLDHYQCCVFDVNLERAKFRARQLKETSKEYDLERNKELGYYLLKKLPECEDFTFTDLWNIESRKQLVLGNQLISSILTMFDKKSTFYEYQKLFTVAGLKLPTVIQNWKSDLEFANQRLKGPNPMHIQLLTENNKPLNFDGILGKFIEKNEKYKTAFANGKLFICDYNCLEGILTKKGGFMGSPICLFLSNELNQLEPIAIQLFQYSDKKLAQKAISDPSEVIYTPSEDPYQWLYAKMVVANADAQVHQAWYHLGYTHLIAETYVVATQKNLAIVHPIYRLLNPHFKNLLAINNRAFAKLISPGGWIDKTMSVGVKGMKQLIAKGRTLWNFSMANPLKNCQNRGVLEKTSIPIYPYRDDSLLYWETIERYVVETVSAFYSDDEIVTKDHEILNWWKYLKEHQILDISRNMTLNRTNLIEVCSVIIFTCTIQHAAVNFPMYDHYGFIPNYPALLVKEVPLWKSQNPFTSEEKIVESLPDIETSLMQISVTYILSTAGGNSKLGNEDNSLFDDEQAGKTVFRFQKELELHRSTISIRNCSRMKYEYLMPENIPNSITI